MFITSLLGLAPAPVSEQAWHFFFACLSPYILSILSLQNVHIAHKFAAVTTTAFMLKSFKSAKILVPSKHGSKLLVPDMHWITVKHSRSGIAPTCLGFHFTLYKTVEFITPIKTG